MGNKLEGKIAVITGGTSGIGLATAKRSSPCNFERRPLGDDYVLIEIKFCGICHSDIHQ